MIAAGPGMDDPERAIAEQPVADALTSIDGGDGATAAQLLPLVYELLRRRAQKMMNPERPGHTLSPTALVHEAYLRVAGRNNGFESRRHFYNAAAQAMRRILVEHARARGRGKRGSGQYLISLESLDVQDRAALDGLDWLALDEALEALARRDPRRHQVVMLRFFAGLADEEVAQMLEVDQRTVRRDWASARLWLFSQLSAAGGEP